MVFDDARVYGFARKPEYLCNASVQEYYLYRADRAVSDEAVQRVQAAIHRIDLASATGDAAESDWAVRKTIPALVADRGRFPVGRGQSADPSPGAGPGRPDAVCGGAAATWSTS